MGCLGEETDGHNADSVVESFVLMDSKKESEENGIFLKNGAPLCGSPVLEDNDFRFR